MKKLLFTALLLLGFQAAIAQHITGKVTDPKGETLAFATVALLSSADSSFVAATTTQDNGTFLLETNKKEGILPAIESSHAVAQAMKLAPQMSKDEIMVICLSGRGDKDVYSVAKYLGEDIGRPE